MAKKVLLIEDDSTLRENTAELLELENYKVLTASNGQEGLNKAKVEIPDIIVLDIMMPKLDGIGVLWELKADEKTAQIPVVVLTNMSDMETISKIMAAGGTDYLLKSDQSIDQIIQKVKDVLSR